MSVARPLQLVERAAKGLPKWLASWFGRGHDVRQVLLKDGTDTSGVTAAVMTHVLSRPDSIRQRAQNAATISGALAVGLVVASVTGLADERESFREGTRWLVFGAIGVFAVSTVLSVFAVVFPHSKADTSQTADYQDLVTQYEAYADEVRQKMRWAATATGLALVLTAVAVVVETLERIDPESDDPKSMTLVLDPEAFSAVEKLCPGIREMAPAIYSTLSEDALASNMVKLEDIGWREEVTPGGTTGRQEFREMQCDTQVTLSRGSIRAASIRTAKDAE